MDKKNNTIVKSINSSQEWSEDLNNNNIGQFADDGEFITAFKIEIDDMKYRVDLIYSQQDHKINVILLTATNIEIRSLPKPFRQIDTIAAYTPTEEEIEAVKRALAIDYSRKKVDYMTLISSMTKTLEEAEEDELVYYAEKILGGKWEKSKTEWQEFILTPNDKYTNIFEANRAIL